MTLGIGHNGQLKAIVERIERLEAEKKAIGSDIKEVYAEAKGNGFDIKILRKVMALRRRDGAERQEEEALIDVYLAGIGVMPETEFGNVETEFGKPETKFGGERSMGQRGAPVDAQHPGDAVPTSVAAGSSDHFTAQSPEAAQPIPDPSPVPAGEAQTAGDSVLHNAPAVASVPDTPPDDLALPDFLKRPVPGSPHYLGAG